MNLKESLKRIQFIYNECAPEAQVNIEAESQLDDFLKSKKQIHRDVKEARALLKERDQIINSGGTQVERAELSHTIRMKIKEIQNGIEKMNAVIEKEEKKKKSKPEELEKISQKKEVLELCTKHLEEIRYLETKEFHQRVENERRNLFEGGEGAEEEEQAIMSQNAVKGGGRSTRGKTGDGEQGPSSAAGRKGTPSYEHAESSLPDIDIAEDLEDIQRKNYALDKDLAMISSGVTNLKGIAIDMGEEIERQNMILDDIDKKVDKVEEHLDNINIKMKKSLDGVMKADRFLVNCVMLCILLALITYIATTFG